MSYSDESRKDLKTIFSSILRIVPRSKARANWREARSYARWRNQNPGKSHSDYYTDVVLNRLQTGVSHPTIGPNLVDGVRFEESGLEELKRLVDGGLLPEHVCVDYGCGSLRIGQHLIRYLNPSHYWGIDATDCFYKIGLGLIDPELLAEKRPHLHVIGPAVLASVKAAEPDFIFCNAVVYHVPPEEIDAFFQNILGLFCTKTTGFINVKFARRQRRVSTRSWAYAEADLVRQIESRGGHVSRIREIETKKRKSWRTRGVRTTWMTVTRKEAIQDG